MKDLLLQEKSEKLNVLNEEKKCMSFIAIREARTYIFLMLFVK